MWKVPLSDVSFGPEEQEAVRAVVASGWLTMGERTQAFEQKLGELLASPRALAVTNGTAALHLAYAALDIGPGDEVICPSLTFVATANAALTCGATVVLADVIGEHDLTLDPVDVERKLTPKTKAIAVVHYAGYPADMAPLLALAEKHGLALVEDAAHAPGGTFGDVPLGTVGDVGCFSFFSNKNLTTGEGGAVAARTDALYARMKLLRSHGMTTLTLDRHKGHAFSYDVVAPGFNYRMDELRSALGLVQLGRLAEGNTRRASLVASYRERLAGKGNLGLPFGTEAVRARGKSAHHIFPVLLPEGTPREAVMTHMKAAGIQTSVHYPPIHRFSHHGSSPLVRAEGLARTDALAPRLLTLPLYPRMGEAEVELVTSTLLDAVAACPPAR
jgi:dTDP-4-amino-4,6-dideoxygalactose transaminase